MVSGLIKEIVEKRKKSLDLEKSKKFEFKDIHRDQNRPTLSETIKKNVDVSIISEIKPSSPTLGQIKSDIDVKGTAIEMEIAGVVGLSVLTEPNYFNGSYENLKLAVENTNLPCLMKDFVVDELQFKVASKLGATNILLINSIVDLIKFYSLAQNYHLETLIEIHDVKEINDLRELFDAGFNPKLFGVNNRNLKTLEIDLNTSRRIIPKLKEEFGEEIQVISESGINSPNDIKHVQPSGANAFLIGSSIMKSNNIKEKIFELRGMT